jgi:hypothetical protein
MDVLRSVPLIIFVTIHKISDGCWYIFKWLISSLFISPAAMQGRLINIISYLRNYSVYFTANMSTLKLVAKLLLGDAKQCLLKALTFAGTCDNLKLLFLFFLIAIIASYIRDPAMMHNDLSVCVTKDTDPSACSKDPADHFVNSAAAVAESSLRSPMKLPLAEVGEQQKVMNRYAISFYLAFISCICCL